MSKYKFSTDKTLEFFLDEGCHIIEILNNPEHSALSFARARVEVGAKTEPHKLIDTSEWYYVLKGQGQMHVDEDTFSVRPHDVIQIPSNATQWIENQGPEELIFLCICQPAWKEEVYRSVKL